MLIHTTGPKVVINVRLMTGPLINHDFEGHVIFQNREAIIFACITFFCADDENLTLTKFKTFQVTMLIRMFPSHF